MIERPARDDLAQYLCRMFERRLTREEKWAITDKKYRTSKDDAVRAVVEFVDNHRLFWHYSPAPPRRGKDPFGEDSELRRTAQRCVAFLSSDLEYEWPAMPKESVAERIGVVVRKEGGPVRVVVALMLVSGGWVIG